MENETTTRDKILNLIEDYECSVRVYIQPYIGDMIEEWREENSVWIEKDTPNPEPKDLLGEYLEMYSGGEDDWGYYEISKEEIETFDPDSMDEREVFYTFGDYWTDKSGYVYCNIQVMIVDSEGEEIEISNELDEDDFISYKKPYDRERKLEWLGL